MKMKHGSAKSLRDPDKNSIKSAGSKTLCSGKGAKWTNVFTQPKKK